jgi:cellulose synthase (UDP-forming)
MSTMRTKHKIAFYTLVGIGLLLTALFGVAWFWPGNMPHNFGGWSHIFDFILYITVSYIVWQQICTELLLWMITEKIERPKRKKPQPGLKVAFITTFVPGSEPVELLERILPALKDADYPHDVWLLDEGRSKEAWAVCQRLGLKYFTRNGNPKYNTDGGKFAVKTKGGNHNAWYDAFGHQYDIVAQIDTDFIPRKDFLTKTLGYFNDPRVAFVGTPQIYGNTKRSFVAKGAAEQLYTFYGPILQGLHGRGMTMMLGANHVVRVAALKEIGYYEAHLTEDLLTGMTLHSNGWKSIYVPERLAVGEGPETWMAYFNQQMRWAFGCMDILFKHSLKLLKRMDWEQRRYYFMMMQHYFSGVAMGLGVVILLLHFLFGIAAATMGLTVILYYIPVILWQVAITMWLQRFNVSPKKEKGLLLAGRVISVAAWPIYLLAFIGVIRGKRLSFKVTPKGKNQESYTPLGIFMPHLVIGLVTALGLEISFGTHHQNPIIVFWALTTILLLLGTALGAWIAGVIKSRPAATAKLVELPATD